MILPIYIKLFFYESSEGSGLTTSIKAFQFVFFCLDLTELEHCGEPVTLGERCTVTRAILSETPLSVPFFARFVGDVFFFVDL